MEIGVQGDKKNIVRTQLQASNRSVEERKEGKRDKKETIVTGILESTWEHSWMTQGSYGNEY